NLPVTFGVKLEHEVMDAFDVSRFSTIAQLQKKVVDDVGFQEGFFFRYNFDLVRTFNLKLSPREIERNDRPVRLGRLSTTYYRDTRNSPFDPDGGTYISLDGQIAALILGGNNQYVRFFGE